MKNAYKFIVVNNKGDRISSYQTLAYALLTSKRRRYKDHIIAQTTEGLDPLTEAHIWNSVAST